METICIQENYISLNICAPKLGTHEHTIMTLNKKKCILLAHQFTICMCNNPSMTSEKLVLL